MTESTPTESSMPDDHGKGEAGLGGDQPADNQALDGQAADDRAANDRAAGGQAPDDQAADGQAASGQAADDQAGDGQAASGQAADGQAEDDAATAQPAGRRRMVLVLVGVAVAAVLTAAAVVFAVMQPAETKVGDCVRETDVVSCEEPHDARIVQIVGNANDCVPPATHPIKEADGRYLCVVEEAG
jgi:hypothetical protein